MPDQEKVSGNRSADRPKTDGRKLYFHDVAHFEPGSHLFSVALMRAAAPSGNSKFLLARRSFSCSLFPIPDSRQVTPAQTPGWH
ncbi:MAG: hypothetical protein WAU14_08935, partial [Dokdonella sp.]|uniref:hypothetical protein n=1 Tax=Dokdonella sp. TaxID=2291710 RepID=UPI003BB0BE3B